MSYFVLKLVSGETVFAEYIGRGAADHITLRHPRVIERSDQGSHFVAWIPYTTDTLYDIKESAVYYMGDMNPMFMQFYLSSIFRDAAMSIVNENNLFSVKERLLEMSKSFSIRYGMDAEELLKPYLDALDISSLDPSSELKH